MTDERYDIEDEELEIIDATQDDDTADVPAEPEPTPEEADNQRKKEKRRRLRAILRDEDEDGEVLHIKDLMRSLTIDGMWFKRHIGILLVIMSGIIVYITNGYQAQHEMIREEQLMKEVKDWRYRSIIVHSKLTTRRRQSKIEELLQQRGDTTLKLSNQSPYELR